MEVSIALLILLTSLVSETARSQSSLRIGSYLQDRSTGISKVILPWMHAVERQLGEQVEFREYWGGTLGRSPHHQFDLVRHGVLDIAWVLPSYTSGQFPQMGLFELPYLFESANEAAIVGWRLHERGLLAGFDDVHLIGFFVAEPAVLFMREPIASLSDIRRKKIRSIGAIHSDWLNAVGASSQTLGAVDMNQALDRDMIDGAIQGWTGMSTFDSYPLVKQVWQIPVGTTPFLVVINRSTWNTLPDVVRDNMMRFGGEALARQAGAVYTQMGEKIRRQLIESDALLFSRPELADDKRLRAVSRSIQEDWVRDTPNGAAVYAAAKAILSELRADARSVAAVDRLADDGR